MSLVVQIPTTADAGAGDIHLAGETYNPQFAPATIPGRKSESLTPR
jgi:hypothetical protein